MILPCLNKVYNNNNNNNKKTISKEINEAESEYMNMGPLNYRSSAVPDVCEYRVLEVLNPKLVH